MKKYLTLLLILTLINLINAQTGWNWQNPLPQGNPLYSISFVSSCGWAVGPMGTALHTSDYGQTWQQVDLGTTQNLNAVFMHDDLMTFIVGDHGLILFVMDHTDHFEITQQSGNTTENLNAVTSDINGCQWIAGDKGTILRADDMGETWVKQNVQYNDDLIGLHNIECTEAWAVGPDGTVLYTSNLGNTWSYRNPPTSRDLFSVHVGTFENIRAVGQVGNIWHTADKGLTWELENENTGYQLYDVLNIGTNAAYAVGTDEAILETIDYGTTWTEPGTDVEIVYTPFYDVESHYGFNHVWVTGHYGTILKNSGIETEFELQTQGTLQFLHAVDFISSNTGWAVGGDMMDLDGNSRGIILNTTDGGQTWQEQLSLSKQLNDVTFIDANEGWAVGRDGMIKHTANGGYSWITQESPISGFLTSVCFTDENNGWIVSRDNWGEIIHTSNGGSSWEEQTNPSANPLHDVFFINENKGWAVGLDTTIIRTIDGGQNWLRTAPYPVTGSLYYSVFFIDENKGWAAGTYGIAVLTEDGGITWQQTATGTTETLTDVYFTDEDNGWMAGDRGTILRSVDGGHSWFRQNTCVATNTLTALHFTDALNGWAVGDGGTIIHSSNGGFAHEPGVFAENGLNLPIYDFEETESTIEVDVSEIIRDNYVLTGLEIFIDTILHSRVSDLEIYLAHNDISDTLIYHVYDDGANFLWTTLTDAAPESINDGNAPFSGNYKPYALLSAFNGTDPNGVWTLTIYDNEEGNEGSLNAWGIKPVFDKLIGIKENDHRKTNKYIRLLQNNPNPFKTSTNIRWESETAGFTTIRIFNINGQEVASLVNRILPAGKHAIDFTGTGMNPGIYFYQLKVGDQVDSKKMLIRQ